MIPPDGATGHRPDATESAGRPRVMVLGWGEKPRVQPIADQLRPIIEHSAEIVAWDLTFEQDLSDCEAELAVVIGGDGSILRAAHQMGVKQRPVLGVNVGKLGFLANLTPDEVVDHWPSVCQRRYRIVQCIMLDCQLYRGGQRIAQRLCLNEVCVITGRGFSLIDIDLHVDGELTTTYSCDGLILSTPIGSTAHNIAAGGPILRQNLSAIVLTPICPHALTMRPVVDDASRVYDMVIQEPHDGTCVVVDGQILQTLEPGDRVRVRQNPAHFRLVEVPNHSYYRTLREKLHWSGTIRGARVSDRPESERRLGEPE